MSVGSYLENGQIFWKFFVNIRSKKRSGVRVQRRGEGFKSEAEARKHEMQATIEAAQKVTELEAGGSTWEFVLLKWRSHYRQFKSAKFCETTIRDYEARITSYAKLWLNRPVVATTMADAYSLVVNGKKEGLSQANLRALKSNLRGIFHFGLQHGLIPAGAKFPFDGVDLFEEKPAERQSLILTRAEILKLVSCARSANHRWFPVWFFALHTGLRSGEICGLRVKDLELVTMKEALKLDSLSAPDSNYGFIRVERQWNSRLKKHTPTKARYWRSVPVNKELFWFLHDHVTKAKYGSDEVGERVFEFYPEWKSKEQAKVIKAFCAEHDLPLITFHTLRACFATQLLSLNVPEIKIMAIGGWRDRETMMIYIRRAGIDEAGSTAGLSFVAPQEAQYENVVNLFSR